MTTPPTRRLRWLLRAIGGAALFAMLAVVAPHSALAWCAERLGVGELFATPLVGYLTRTLCLLYVFVGVFFLIFAADIERYRPAIAVTGLASVFVGVATTVITWAVGMPLWWVCLDGPAFLVCGVLLIAWERQSRDAHAPDT